MAIRGGRQEGIEAIGRCYMIRKNGVYGYELQKKFPDIVDGGGEPSSFKRRRN